MPAESFQNAGVGRLSQGVAVVRTALVEGNAARNGGGGGGGGIGGGEDMVETRVPDTKLVGLGFLPALLRRLYGQNSEGWGRGRRLRRVGAVARKKRAARLGQGAARVSGSSGAGQ